MSDLNQNDIEPVFDAEALGASIRDLGRRINDELAGEDLLLVALLGGSVIFLADLVRAIARPVRFEFIQVGSAETVAGPEVTQIRYPLPLDLAGQSVLVLKDVVTSGVTEPYLEQQLRDHGAREVRFAALIDIPDERKTAFEVTYAAIRTGRQGVLVGYGLKQDARYGNLPYVGRLRGTA
ncbi:MAG TPA: phosphoribosyltransferase family protein [Thermoanaerobaculia bacterium]|jgi:hypoxanthine phosphoribosyltransferase|nr:phosphoribosyltransferase family protein [Thermoanaerobaculia bacterium]